MEKPSPHPAVRALLALVVLALVVAAGWAAHGVYRIFHRGSQVAERLVGDLEDVLHFRPQVTVNGATIASESRTIQELALVQKAFAHTLDWKQTYLGSTKEIELRGDFLAKAGFDLTQPFSVDVSADGKTIRTATPPAKILSVEQTRLEVLKDEDGWWNKISPEDRQEALNAMLRDARDSLGQTALLTETDQALLTLLQAQFRKESPDAFVEIDHTH